MASILQTEIRQKSQIKKLKHREHLMKWIIGVGLVFLLLLLLLLGFATDWTRGLRKDSSISPTKVFGDPAPVTGQATDEATQSDRTATNNSGINRSSTTNSSEKTTTETNTTTPTSPSSPSLPSLPSVDLLGLYESISVGDAIDESLGLANMLGVSANCQNDLLIQTCTFSEDGYTLSTKNLLGSNFITSVTKNF